MTRRGIEYELFKSPYVCENEKLKFYFSSDLHLKKFQKLREEKAEKIRVSLSNRFNVDFDVWLLGDLIAYRETETRGFFVIDLETGKPLNINKVKLSLNSLYGKGV